jgi:hypothetical protein
MALFGLSLPAAAQKTDDKPGTAAPQSSFTDARLNAFANAAKGVYAVRQKYGPKFEAAADDAEKKNVVLSARAEMEKVIVGHGLTVEQYNEILVAAKDDQALAEKLSKLLGPPPGG